MYNSLSIFILAFIPAALANSIPPVAAKILPKLNTPIDFGHTFRGKRIFGDHKTIRGYVCGVLIGCLGFLLFRSFISSTPQLPWHFGAIVSFLALFGDSLKSFFKRQMGISSGSPWFPYDQIDWLIGTAIAMLFYGITDVVVYVLIFVLGFLGHLLSKYLGYKAGINDTSF